MSVVGPDLFGFGATPPPPEPWGTDEYARQLLPLFDEPGVLADRIVVVGHSFGGRVAVRLHALVPGRIERMVLCGVPLLDRQGRRVRPAAAYRLVRRLHRMGLIGDDRMDAARNRYGSPDYRAAQGVMREVFVKILAEQYADELGSIACPVDLLWGEKDSEVPVEVAMRARGMFPEASVTVIPGVGHLVPTEAPRGSSGCRARQGPRAERDSPTTDRPEPAIDEDPMAGPREHGPAAFPIDGLDASRFHSGVAWITVAVCVAACVPAGLRWLRVAQREHYLAGSASRFAVRWWRATPVNTDCRTGRRGGGAVSLRWPIAGVVTACVAAAGPLGLSLRGRTSPLTWTSRLRRLAVVVALFEARRGGTGRGDRTGGADGGRGGRGHLRRPSTWPVGSPRPWSVGCLLTSWRRLPPG